MAAGYRSPLWALGLSSSAAATAGFSSPLFLFGLASASSFPTQYFGLRTYFHSAVQNLCLVAEADAPTGMGGVIKVDKNGTKYAVYLVETTDPNATPVRVKTSTGTKSVRIKT